MIHLTDRIAATSFAKSYYSTLQNGRDLKDSITNYYCGRETGQDGSATLRIVWNGNHIPDAESFFTLFSTRMPPTFYDIQTVDAHVLSNRYYADLSAERNFSMILIVGGYVRLEDATNGPLHEFSETFCLIPNRAKLMGKGAAMSKRDYLIQNQVFRYVVSHDPIQTAGYQTMDVDEMT